MRIKWPTVEVQSPPSKLYLPLFLLLCNVSSVMEPRLSRVTFLLLQHDSVL